MAELNRWPHEELAEEELAEEEKVLAEAKAIVAAV
jgi:hypothetical protein